MSSPPALGQQAPNKSLGALEHALAGGRIDLLAQRIAMHVESLVPRGRARCLDVGCGDATLAEAVQEHAPRTDWRCIDARDLAREARKHDGRTVPFEQREYDVALLCDVLHRMADDGAGLLAEAGQRARRVLVKDQFEYGTYSRTLLRVRDYVGNRRSGADVPRHYFTREAFSRLATEQGFVITALDCGLSLYEHVPVARTVLRPDCDFIAVLRRV
jgi:hypothetical protein